MIAFRGGPGETRFEKDGEECRNYVLEAMHLRELETFSLQRRMLGETRQLS